MKEAEWYSAEVRYLWTYKTADGGTVRKRKTKHFTVRSKERLDVVLAKFRDRQSISEVTVLKEGPETVYFPLDKFFSI